MANQKQDKKARSSSSKQEETREVVPAVVEGLLGRTGTRGEITQVKARILQGRNKGKSMRRNVRGPIKQRDILMLRETEIEARRLQRNVSKGAFS